MKLANEFLVQTIAIFHSSKSLADRTFAQLSFEELTWSPNEESNSIAIIVKHMSGNMISRWTDFLTTDGEKPWRNRDTEFDANYMNKEELLQSWEKGWSVLFDTLEYLDGGDLLKTITIRGENHSVIQAIHRQISHYSTHIGQIVYIGKQIKNNNWQTLSIPRGNSQQYLEQKLRENQKL